MDSDVTIPMVQTVGSAGADLHAWIEDCPFKKLWFNPGDTIKVSTKLAVQIPKGHFGGIFARSGTAFKKGLAPVNGVGVIDETYTGEVIVALHNYSTERQFIEQSERIAQLVIIPYVRPTFIEVDELSKTERGECGFGSTGAK